MPAGTPFSLGKGLRQGLCSERLPDTQARCTALRGREERMALGAWPWQKSGRRCGGCWGLLSSDPPLVRLAPASLRVRASFPTTAVDAEA